jgi:hypothetical protein
MPMWQLPRSNAPAGATQCAAPRELVRFGRMLLADGVAEDGSRVLPAGAFAAMREPQIGLPRISEQDPTGYGLGLTLFDWDGVPLVGHDGGTIAQLTCWRIVPDRNVVIALSLNGVPAAAFADDVLAPVLAEVADIRLPRPPVPPAEPVPFRPDPYVGTFAGPLSAFEVSATDGGLDVTRVPQGLAAAAGEQPDTTRYVALGDDSFIAAEPQDGTHPTVYYLRGGRYLVSGLRVLPRVSG